MSCKGLCLIDMFWYVSLVYCTTSTHCMTEVDEYRTTLVQWCPLRSNPWSNPPVYCDGSYECNTLFIIHWRYLVVLCYSKLIQNNIIFHAPCNYDISQSGRSHYNIQWALSRQLSLSLSLCICTSSVDRNVQRPHASNIVQRDSHRSKCW